MGPSPPLLPCQALILHIRPPNSHSPSGTPKIGVWGKDPWEFRLKTCNVSVLREQLEKNKRRWVSNGSGQDLNPGRASQKPVVPALRISTLAMWPCLPLQPPLPLRQNSRASTCFQMDLKRLHTGKGEHSSSLPPPFPQVFLANDCVLP